ncbi:MAG TPA: hypothetical protein DCX07_08085 [Phycisphaerales bacterium]|nr:hypothetical protein [Phycisphaerales bacterium]
MWEWEPDVMSRLDVRDSMGPAAPVQAGLCVVMVCTDLSEAELVGQYLSELNTGCLVTYRRTEDLQCNTPAGRVALIVLATQEGAPSLRRALRWLRNRWPRCPLAVVGDAGCGDHELAAREGGALYLTRPVPPSQWAAVLSHVLTGTERQAEGSGQLK